MQTLKKEHHIHFFIPDVEIEDYNVMIGGRNFFDQPVNHKERTYYNIQNIVNGREEYIMTSCLLDYHNFKDHHKIIIIID